MARDSKLKTFYNSDKWINFRLSEINKRINTKGELICEYCNKPITDPKKAIAHHKKELTDDNVDNAMISLNPEEIMIVHFECHNKIHHRFGNKVEHGVFIVYGAPLAGKNTYVKDHMQRGDLVVNIDRLYNAISMLPPYDKPNNLFFNAIGLQNLLIDNIKTRYGKWNSAWIVGGYADKYKREKLAKDLGAVLIFIDVCKEVCLQRLENDKSVRRYHKADWNKYIDEWFERYLP